jgi:pimeloyl-ACP methyl ester carboxylesterase
MSARGAGQFGRELVIPPLHLPPEALMPFVDAGDARLHYQVMGPVGGASAADAPALVFAHGAGGNAASWWQQVPAFCDRHRVLSFDHRGFGRSTCTEFSSKHFDADLVAILDAAGIERAVIVCQSMGGWTGLRTAALHPARVAGLVLANTPGAVFSDALVSAMRNVRPLATSDGLHHPAISDRFVARDPAGAYLYNQIAALNLPRDDVGRGLMAREGFLTPAQLEAFATPTLVVASELDDLFPPALLHATAALLKARVVDVDDAGHSTYFERPDAFNHIVAGFLRELGLR